MDYKIRTIEEKDYSILEDFLYEAIYIPEGVDAPPRDIIKNPELQMYIADFGKQKDDKGVVAEADNKIVGAAWVRIMDDYGHIDNNTPSLAISLLKEYRGMGIGTDLLNCLLMNLKNSGYSDVSLAVQKANYALKMYKKAGFEIVGENEQEYIMNLKL